MTQYSTYGAAVLAPEVAYEGYPYNNLTCNMFCDEDEIPEAISLAQAELNIPTLMAHTYLDPKSPRFGQRRWCGCNADYTIMWSLIWCPQIHRSDAAPVAVVGLNISPVAVLNNIMPKHEKLYYLRTKELLS